MRNVQPDSIGARGDELLKDTRPEARARARAAAANVVEKLIALMNEAKPGRNAAVTVQVAKLILEVAASEPKKAATDDDHPPAPATHEAVAAAEAALEGMH